MGTPSVFPDRAAVIGTVVEHLLGEDLLAVPAEAGLDPTEAARASYLLIVQVLGAIALEAAELPSPAPAPPIAERLATRREQLRAVPADRYPRTAEAADTIARFVSDERYAWGLDRVLDGIGGRAWRRTA